MCWVSGFDVILCVYFLLVLMGGWVVVSCGPGGDTWALKWSCAQPVSKDELGFEPTFFCRVVFIPAPP